MLLIFGLRDFTAPIPAVVSSHRSGAQVPNRSQNMSSKLLVQLNQLLQRVEHAFPMLFGGKFPPGALALADCPAAATSAAGQSQSRRPFQLSDLIGDGFLWAVPRNRRTIEKRWKRKFGSPEYINKLLVPKANLRSCNKCGGDFEVGILCPTCYEKVRTETEAMQAQIQAKLGLQPVDQEVVVLYAGEKGEQPQEFWQGKRVVEMPKQRPAWFSRNLLQKTTQQPATTKEVKPNDLG